jgi:DNA mismatch repair ATPase MutS
MNPVDTNVGDLSSVIVDMELRIMRDIVKKILQSSHALSITADVSSELDVLTSFALVVRICIFQLHLRLC